MSIKTGGAGKRDEQAGNVIVCSVAPAEHVACILIYFQVLFFVFLLGAAALKAEIPCFLGAKIELPQLLFGIGFSAHGFDGCLANYIPISHKTLRIGEP